MRTIRNIGVVFIVSLLILATGGFSVYHHVCHCAGEMSASVFIEAGCGHENSQASCCNTEEKNSCCMEQPGHDSKRACHDQDCCQNSIQFLKIYDSFQPGLAKINLKPCLVATALVFIDIPDDIRSTTTLDINSADLPPPDTGRQILISLHQLKLDTHLV